MRRFRFTAQLLAAITTDKERELVFDEQVPALALQITKTGSKSFYVIKRLPTSKFVQRLGSFHEIPIPKARAMAAEMLLSLLSGDTRPATRKRAITLSQALDEHLAFTKARRRASTLKVYTDQADRFLRPWAGSSPLTSIRRADVTKLHLHLGEHHGKTQANRVIALLRATYNRAIREHELEIPNPTRSIETYPEQKRSRRLERHEVASLFAELDKHSQHTRDFFLLALYTGARRWNMMTMRWEDISLEAATWTIPAAKYKTGEQTTLVLSSMAVEILLRRRADNTGGSPFVFPGSVDGHMGSPASVWDRIRKAAGVPDLRIHDLRRSLASFQIDTGAPLEVIQKTMGHQSRITTETYARLAMGPVRESLERATEEMLSLREGQPTKAKGAKNRPLRKSGKL